MIEIILLFTGLNIACTLTGWWLTWRYFGELQHIDIALGLSPTALLYVMVSLFWVSTHSWTRWNPSSDLSFGYFLSQLFKGRIKVC